VAGAVADRTQPGEALAQRAHGGRRHAGVGGLLGAARLGRRRRPGRMGGAAREQRGEDGGGRGGPETSGNRKMHAAIIPLSMAGTA